MLDMSAWDDATPDESVIVADGAYVKIVVYGNCLVIEDGKRNAPRKRTIPGVPRKLRLLIILSTHGYVSLDAKAWMHHRSINWYMIDRTGKTPYLIETSSQNTKPSLVRKQAYCAPDGPMRRTGVAIFQRFITRKLEGQAWNAEHLLGDPIITVMDGKDVYEGPASKYIREQIGKVELADWITQVLGYEGQGAKAYWQAWNGIPAHWCKPAPVQPHWQAYGLRRTLRRNYADNRNATDPINAMLNFAYHCAEAECILACYGAWLSPDLGIGHVDRDGRASFAVDLIEVIRPKVDQIILEILASEKLDKRMFHSDREDIVRLRAPMTHRIASSIHKIAYKIQPEINYVVNALNGKE